MIFVNEKEATISWDGGIVKDDDIANDHSDSGMKEEGR